MIQNYTLNLNIVKKKNHRHFKKQINLQSQANYDDKKNSKKNSHILGDNTSGGQVGDIEQVTI